jgi:hypothetical protein
MPSIATVIPAMDHIDEHLATAAIDNEYPLAIKAALAIGKKTLNCYYDKTDHSEVFTIAISMYFFTEPRCKQPISPMVAPLGPQLVIMITTSFFPPSLVQEACILSSPSPTVFFSDFYGWDYELSNC